MGQAFVKPLPPNITIDLSFTRDKKAIGQPDQFNLNPDRTFEEFISEMTENVKETVKLSEVEEVKFGWKWEKRITTQTGARKLALPYNVLHRVRHWEAILQILREANAIKSGCHNMLLRIQASIMAKSEDQNGEDDSQELEIAGRIVVPFFTSLMTLDFNVAATCHPCQYATL